MRYAVVAGASPSRVVIEADRTLLAPFIAAAQALEAEGCVAIATSCGFLALFQRELQAAVAVPVWTSSLLLVPELQAALPAGRRVGVVTADAASLTPRICSAPVHQTTRQSKACRPTRRSSDPARKSAGARCRPAEAATVAAALRLALGTRSQRDRARMHQHAAVC